VLEVFVEAVILAAGFGERLRPITDTTPKALLDIGGKPVIDHLLDFFCRSKEIGGIHIRTNALYYPVFREWLKGCDYMGRVELSSNGVSSIDNRRGAVADLESVCSKKKFNNDILVAASDNLFDFHLDPFLEFCSDCDGDVVAVMDNGSRTTLREGGVVAVTSNDRVIDFAEKPSDPKSDLYTLPLYRLSAETIPFLTKYIVNGNDPDCLGCFFEWSYRRRPLFAYKIDGGRYHLTNEDSYKRIVSAFAKDIHS
jgi:glucose-1-phosphate thymidylyltransferase